MSEQLAEWRIGSGTVNAGTDRIDPEPQDIGLLYERAMPSTRGGPLFNAFSYPTKISPEVIALYIATHTHPGDTVLDVFAGSGTTGIAARLCDAPTPEMLALAETLGVRPQWGPRKAVLYEISVIGSLLAEQMTNPPDPDRFAEAARDLIASAADELSWMYEAVDPDGNIGRIRHVTWSEVLECVCCNREVTYWDAAVRMQPLRLETEFECPGCEATLLGADCPRATVRVVDQATGEKIESRKRVPARIYGSTGKRTWQREPVPSDLDLFDRISEFEVKTWFPSGKVFWGDLYRGGYHQGLNRFHHFYTKRNLAALSLLWAKIDNFPYELRDSLKLLVLSFNAAHSTLMTRVVLKNGQKDFVLTGAQSGVLYVSGLPVEKNVFEGVARKIRTFSNAFRLTRNSRSEVIVCNASSTQLELPSKCVAYVFTDPPFGAYIPYAELNQVNEAWLRKTTDRTEEAIISPAQGKTIQEYGMLLKDVFAEVARVLKPNGLATVVFHSSKADVWKAVARSFETAGLEVMRTSVLDKTQTSFKQTVSSVSSRGDALFLLSPSTVGGNLGSPAEDHRSLVRDVVRRAFESRLPSELQPDRLYSRYVSTCVASREQVSMGAAEFYTLVASFLADADKSPKNGQALDIKRQKRLGQYFTGLRLASLLAYLSDGLKAQSVVDPMVGTGDMITAVLGTGAKVQRVGGIEIDPKAFAACLERSKTWHPNLAVKLHNSSAFEPAVVQSLGLQNWDLVITNPPYVRYQLTSRTGTHDIPTPSAEVVRAGLIESLSSSNDSLGFFEDLVRIAKSYSGLADLAVPSWILCAGLVREGGTLAMVVPDTWLSRDYARPIRELLDHHFDVEFVVEDTDASWFDAALVRTTLVVSRRRAASTSAKQLEGYVHIRLGRSSADTKSLVSKLFPGDTQPDKSFAQTARDCLKSHSTLRLSGCDLEWIPRPRHETSPHVPAIGKVGGGVASPLIPERLARRLGDTCPEVISLRRAGWSVGQGLRTGANVFFYADLIKQSGKVSTLRPDGRLWKANVSVPSGAVRRVVRSQADVGATVHVNEDQILGAVLCLQDYLLPRDRDGIPLTLDGLSRQTLKTIPAELAAYIEHVEMADIGTEGESRFVPELSAVVTNVRKYDPRRPDLPARFWYQLPPFANRHQPNLFVARVNYRHPKTFHNVGRCLLIDANFSTFWINDAHAVSPLAMLALLRSTWALAVMETSGTVMGGGALKLEATQLRRFPVPAHIEQFDARLAELGETLSGEPSPNWQRRVDEVVWRALGIAEAPNLAQQMSGVLSEMLGSRSR